MSHGRSSPLPKPALSREGYAYVWALSSMVITAVPGVLALVPPRAPQATGRGVSPTKVYPPPAPVEHWVRRAPSSSLSPPSPSPPPSPAPAAPKPPPPRLYPIRWGDTLWALAQRFGVSVAALQKANGLGHSTLIRAGATLVIPPTERVLPGESWAQLARRLGVPTTTLRAWNPGLGEAPPAGATVVVPVTGRPPRPRPAVRAPVPAMPSRGLAHPPVELSSSDVLLLAHLVQAEAGNQPFVGQVAVAAVALNRLRSPEFPKTLRAVVFEPGQFESVANGSIWNPPSNQALMAARAAQAGWDPTGGALYFYNPTLTRDHWITTLPVVARIGQQVFAR